MLASAYRPSSGLVDDPVKEELEPIFGKDTAIVQGLRTLADDESRATKRLLAPLHVLIYERRLRHRYEPTGVARRQLRRSVAISRHALAVSEMGVLHSWSSDSAWVRLRIWTRRAAVRGRHLGLSTLSSGWNAHYNAACFYALLHDRKATGENLDSKELRTLRRRAYEELNTAIDKAGPELDLGWLTKDPDLKKLRELGEPEWRVLLRRHGGTSGATDPLLPEAPGGSPERRRNTSLAFGVTSLALAVLSAIFVQFPSVLAVGVVVALVIGGVVCLSHARVLGRNAAARRDRSRTLRTGTP
jgi:hypothetical protein